MAGPHESPMPQPPRRPPPGPEPPGSTVQAAQGGSGRGSAGGRGQGGPAGGRYARSTGSAILLVLAGLLLPVALVTVWVHDIVLDTDRYVTTVSPLARDRNIQDLAADRIADAARGRANGKQVTSDLAAWLQSQGLRPRAADAVKGLAPQFDAAVGAVVGKAATRFVRSDTFEQVWTQSNRSAHDAVVDALTGEGRGAVGVEGNTVTLDVGKGVARVKQELVAAGVAPASLAPDVHKQLVLFHSDKLDNIRNAVHALDVIGNWLPVTVVGLAALGMLLAHDRRRALARTALGAALACLVVSVGLVIARRSYLDHLPSRLQSEGAAATVFDTMVRFLRNGLYTSMVLGVIVALGAYFVGPGRLPRAVRGLSQRAADSAAAWGYAHEVRTGRAGVWFHRQQKAVALGALLVAGVVFALVNEPTVPTVLILALVLLAVLAVLSLLSASGRITLAAEQGPGGPERRPDSDST